MPRPHFVPQKYTKYLGRLLAGGLLVACLACDSGPVPTPTPLLVPTIPPPQVQRPIVLDTPTPVPPTPAPAQLGAAAALLDRWALGDAALGGGVESQPMSHTAASDFTALALQRAPVMTPTDGVQIEPAVLVADAAGKARALAFAVGGGAGVLVPDQVVWAERGAAAAILFTWRVDGRPVENRPFLLLDATGARRGPVLWTLASATRPTWAPGGAALAYIDGSPTRPRLIVADDSGQVRVTGPAANLECDRCWPDGLWAPDGRRWAYTTSVAVLSVEGTPAPLGQLTWRLVALDATDGKAVFDQTGQAVGVAQVVGWTDTTRARIVVRTPLLPADQITGTRGNWADTPYVLRFDTTPPRLEPASP